MLFIYLLNLLTIKNFKPWDKVAVSDEFYTCLHLHLVKFGVVAAPLLLIMWCQQLWGSLLI